MTGRADPPRGLGVITRAAPAEHPAVPALVATCIFVIFISPSRFYMSVLDTGGYESLLQPNLMDVLWLGLALLLLLHFRRVPLVPWFGISVLMLVGFAAMEPDTPELFADLMLYNTRWLAALTIGYLLAGSPAGTLTLTRVYFWGSILIALSGLFLLRGGGEAYQFYAAMQRYGALGLAPNSTAAVIAAALAMLPFLAQRDPWVVWSIPVFTAGLTVTGSRTGVLLAAPSVVGWLWFLWRAPRARRHRVRWLAILAVAWFLGYQSTVLVQGAQGGTVVASTIERLAETGTDASLLYRIELYTAVVDYLRGAPTTLATGLGGSNVAVEALLDRLSFDAGHAHNLVLQVLVANGIFGLVFWAWIIWRLFRPWERDRPEVAALQAFAVILLAGHGVDYHLQQQKFLLLFMTVVGIFLAPRLSTRPPSLYPRGSQ